MSDTTEMDIEQDKLLSIELTPQKINTLNTLRRFERLPDNNYTSVPKTNCTELSLHFMDIISSSVFNRCNSLQTLKGKGLPFLEVKRLLEQHFNFLIKFHFVMNTIQDLEKYLPANHATIGSLKHPHGLHHAVIFIKNNANMLSLADLQQNAIFNGLPAIESYFINNNYDTSVIGLWWGIRNQNIEVQNRTYIPPQYNNGGKKQKNKNKKSLRKNKNKKSLRKNKNKKSLRKKQFNN